MGTLNTFDFEGTSGATVSGSGITLTGTGTAVYDTGDKIVGGSSASLTTTAVQTRAARCTLAASSKTMAFDVLFKTDAAYPASVLGVFSPRHSSGAITSGGVQWSSAGKLYIVTTGNTDLLSPNTTNVIPTSTWVRLQIRFVVGTTGTDGTIDAETYLWNGTTWVQQGSTYSYTARSLGTNAVTAFDVGILSTISGVNIKADCIRAEDGRTTAFGALPSPGATTASVALGSGATQYPQTGGTVLLDASASTGSGTLSYSWACTSRSDGAPTPSISGATTATPTVTIPASDFAASPPVLAGAQYEMTCTVTGSGGSNSAAIILYAHEAPGSTNTIGVHSLTPGLWTSVGGATAPIRALNDRSSTTLMESPDSPTSSQKLTGTFRPFGDGTPTITMPSLYSGTATNATFNLYLENGTTLVDTDTWALGSTESAHTLTLDSTALAILGTALSDRRALKFEYYGS